MGMDEGERDAVLGRPLEDLDVPTWLLTKLYELGPYERTIGSIVKYSGPDLVRKIDRFGPKSVEVLSIALAKWGVSLATINYRSRR